MSTLRPSLQRQIARPHLSTRYVLLLRRQNSTSSPAAASPTTTTTNSSPRRRSRAAILWSALGLLTGLSAGAFAMHTLVPPSLPGAGTHGDSVLLEDLEKRIDNEFTVKVLRGKCLGVAKALKGEQTGWVEVVAPPNCSSSSQPGNGGTLMASLRGSSNLGVERTFWAAEEQKLVSIVWLGGDLSGWPGVVHGGLLATVVTEKVALANALANGEGGGSGGVSDAAVPQRMPGSGSHATMSLPGDVPVEPAQMSIDYLKPTYANNFHVIRVVPSWASGENVRIPVEGDEWVATLETLEKQRVCVRAAAKFEPRSQAERARGKVAEGAKWSYHEFREWLWPSRQRQVQQGQAG